MHILKTKTVETFYKIRLPYHRKFENLQERHATSAILIAHDYLKTMNLDFVEVYRIDIDENEYYEASQTLIAKLYNY